MAKQNGFMVRLALVCSLTFLIFGCVSSEYSTEVDQDQDGTADYIENLESNDPYVSNSASPSDSVLGDKVLKKYSSSGYKETDWFTVRHGDTLAVAWKAGSRTFYLSVCERRDHPRECELRARQNRDGLGRFYVGESGRHYFKVRGHGSWTIRIFDAK